MGGKICISNKGKIILKDGVIGLGEELQPMESKGYKIKISLSNISEDSRNKHYIEKDSYNVLKFYDSSYYYFPNKITVNGTEVGKDETKCSGVTASWDSTLGTLYLEKATSKVNVSIVGLERVVETYWAFSSNLNSTSSFDINIKFTSMDTNFSGIKWVEGEGMVSGLYYKTNTGPLKVYSNGSWCSDKGDAYRIINFKENINKSPQLKNFLNENAQERNINYPKEGDIIISNLDGSEKYYRVLYQYGKSTFTLLGLSDINIDNIAFSPLSNDYWTSALDSYINGSWYEDRCSKLAQYAIQSSLINTVDYNNKEEVFKEDKWRSTHDKTSETFYPEEPYLLPRKVYSLEPDLLMTYWNRMYEEEEPDTITEAKIIDLFGGVVVPPSVVWMSSKVLNEEGKVWVLDVSNRKISLTNHDTEGIKILPVFGIDLFKAIWRKLG